MAANWEQEPVPYVYSFIYKNCSIGMYVWTGVVNVSMEYMTACVFFDCTSRRRTRLTDRDFIS